MQSSNNNNKLGSVLCERTSDHSCESGVSMKCKCRKLPLFALILSLVFVLCNVSLAVQLTTTPYYDYKDNRDHHHHHLSTLPSNKTQEKSAPFKMDVPVQQVVSEPEKEQPVQPQQQPQPQRRNRNKPAVEPQAASLAPNSTLAACLLIKDDNSILSEWIAYHYHTIRLRHLVVAVDPSSRESPHNILEKWLPYLDITEWHDADYMPTQFLETGRAPTPRHQQQVDDTPQEVVNHRYRQRVFLAQCLRTMHKNDRSRSWVMHIDTDEFVVPSKLLRQMEPDYVTLIPIEEPGSVLNLIQQVVRKTADLVSYPCISMLRVLFGSVESTEDERNDQVPEQFNAMSFESLRWRYHGLPHNIAVNGNPKVLLDLSSIADRYLERDEEVYSIHRPLRDFCPKNKDLKFSSFREQPIGVHHFLGSWERYSGRNDKRRSRSVYDQKALANRGVDDGLRPWLRGFVQSMGLEAASTLLGDSYLLTNRTAVTDSFVQTMTI